MKCVVFDKTGTLTEGCFKVCSIISGASNNNILRKLMAILATAESSSEHPIAKAIVDYCKEVKDFINIFYNKTLYKSFNRLQKLNPWEKQATSRHIRAKGWDAK